MMLRGVFILLSIPLCLGLPQAVIRLPEVDFSPPEEINAHLQHKHFARSISQTPKSQNTLEDTIKEVEELISSDPSLPRLTRGEIVDILENLTKPDVRLPKAIMVVKPYEVGNGKSIEEIYTKPPVTQIIGAEPFKKSKATPSTTTSTTTTTTTEEITTKKPYRGSPYYRKTTTTPPIKKEDPFRPLKRRRPSLSTEKPIITTYHPSRRPMRRRTTTKHPNHKYPEDSKENFVSNEGIRVVQAPKLVPTDLNYDLEMMQAQENFNTPTVKPFKKLPPLEPSIELIVPEHLKKVVGDLNLDNLDKVDEDTKKIKEILSSIGIQDIPVTTSTTTKPDASVVADNLSPEMKELLVTFGLLADPNKRGDKIERVDESFNPEKAEVSPDSYLGFKRLPEENSPTTSGMEELLAQFGLGRSARKEKSIKKQNLDNKMHFDVVPEIYRDVLQDIGLVERSARKIRAHDVEKQHVFTPAKYATLAQIEKVEKLTKLMTAIKELEKLNRTITQEDMKNIDIIELKQLLSSLNKSHQLDEEHAPNPVNFDPGVSRNEVKRQEEVETTTLIIPEEESNTPSLKDLEDSFGGKKDTPTSTTTEAAVETTTALRKTGFYYLVDWNTFLDIDDQNGKRVNLRFQPTVGDPKRFFSVTVP